jgi:PKD repeat protein
MKKIYFTLLFIFTGCFLWANPVSMESARKVAENFYRHYSPSKSGVVVDSYANDYQGTVAFYTFIFDTNDFVIVAADDAVIPVLGYSDEGTFDKNNIPENAQNWFANYSKEIKSIIDKGIDNTISLKMWNNIRNKEFSDSKAVVTPLCATTWDQGCYYNTSCPAATGGDCNHVYTGCVATAMSQIMKKWNYPATGVGTHTYTDATYGSQTVNFGTTTYDWSATAMPNNVTSSKPAVATLMYHAGVSVNMAYGVNGSGAYSWDVPNALISYFNYSPSAELQIQANFTSANWISMLKNELDNARPVYYSGDDGTEGHAFVCDGYNSSSAFHFNWGWSGSANGYFSIGSLTPSGYTFDQNNMAVVRIQPPTLAPVANFSVSTTTPAVGGSVNFFDASTNTPLTWSWTFDGGTPSTSTVQNPTNITYATAGLYQVTLTVTNASGNDTKIRSQYINVGGTPSAWIKQNSGFATASRGIDQICIVNPFIIWAKAYDGTSTTNYIREFTKTTNGGITWTPGSITFTNSTNYGVSNIFPLNDTVCYASMFPTTGTGGKIVKTTNGGTTWTEQTTAPFTSSWADFVHFFDVNNGVCMGDPIASAGDFAVYTTSNGGTTWTQITAANIPNATTTEAGISNLYDAVGNTIWFGTTFGNIYKSIDKGLTWTKTATGLGTAAVADPVFKDATTGIVTGTNNSTGVYIGMKKTINGGTTWTTVTPTGFYVKNPHIDYVPGTTGMWVDVSSGAGIGSAYSTNDCSSFLNIDTGSVQYTVVTFYDINTGWAGGYNTSATDGGIFKWDYSLITKNNDFVDPRSENVTVFPNPASDKLYLGFSMFADKEAQVEIFNTLGAKVYSIKVDPIFNPTVELNLPKLETGVYVVSINTGTTVVTKKITIE